ncbi:TonB-dependent receptor [Flagellimonas nanhaiensis]|nr:TonB-dependent receptor [Allomuricauda nanhaiensis]
MTHNITFNYESDLLVGIEVLPPSKDLSLENTIRFLERQTPLIFTKISDLVYTITRVLKLCGYIQDASLQQPLEGVTVNGRSGYTVTDEKGYFEIELASLSESLTLRHIGFKTIERQARFFNIGDCGVIPMLEQAQVMSPSAYLVRGIDKRQDWNTSIDYKKFSLLPGLIEGDVLQTVQALPGIISVDETVSNINIRGGSHDQNLILWDGIKMFQSGHFFGLISSFNPHMTQSATIIHNGSDVSYTDGVSGTIHMQTDQQLQPHFSGLFSVNFLNADLLTNIPLGGKSSLQVAARKSVDNLVRTPTYDVYFDRVTQDTEAQENVSEVTNSDQAFNFYDTSLRWLYNPSDRDMVRVNFLLINNDLSFNETASVDGAIQTRESSVSQNSLAAGLHYRRHWSDAITTVLNIYETDYKLQSINANVLADQRFLQENTVSETGVKVEGTYRREQWQFKLGYDFVETEVVNLNDIDLPRFVRRDEEVLREHAAYGQALFRSRDKGFTIRSGIRLNYLSKFKELILEPRISIRQALGDHFEMEAQGEYKHQSTSQIVNFQNDFLGIEKRRWQLSDNDAIPILKSKQASLGLLYKKDGWLLDTKLFLKKIDGITTQSQSFTTKYEFIKESGSYTASGVEFLLRKKFNTVHNWLSYSYLKNTYTFENLEEVEFPSNFDITHSITLGTTYSDRSWDISAGVNYRTGKPTSIPLPGNEIIDDDVNFDQANDVRLQDYLRLDASAIHKFKINDALRSEIGASVWNLTDRKNSINTYYRINQSGTIDTFSRFSLGITSNVVFRLYF